MPTVILRPTGASEILGFNDIELEDAIAALSDNNVSTRITSSDDGENIIQGLEFSTNGAYDSSISTINRITLNISGKSFTISSQITPLLQTTHRGQTVNVSSLSGFVNGNFEYATSHVNLASPNSTVAINDDHIDNLTLNFTLENGSISISEIYIEVDYTSIPAGSVKISEGFIELKQGFISL